jgi:L-fuculokinase
MYTFVFDIGKTNIKGAVLDERGQTVWTQSCANLAYSDATYDFPCIDVENIWVWLKSTLKAAAEEFSIDAINVSTHGACAVLLSREEELLFPVIDYEVEKLAVEGCSYLDHRPDYSLSLSPDLPGGLNLGRQIWWLKQTYPDRFKQLGQILLYPQYWVWKLTGQSVTEATSLGCHTDLWEPLNQGYSSLVSTLGIKSALPPLVDSFSGVGHVRKALADDLGLPGSCMVFPGVHDSNGSLARYLASDLKSPFNVVSTGTWVIVMAVGNPGNGLLESRDMLANVDVNGNPVPCARFMGGREFEKICQLTGVATDEPVTQESIQAIIDDSVFAVPPFEVGSGPFRQAAATKHLTGEVNSGTSLATIYLALMVDYELELLNAKGPILFGSASQKNPLLCQLLAQLRPLQQVFMSNDNASTIKGAWSLTRKRKKLLPEFSDFEIVQSAQIEGLTNYQKAWRKQALRENP